MKIETLLIVFFYVINFIQKRNRVIRLDGELQIMLALVDCNPDFSGETRERIRFRQP